MEHFCDDVPKHWESTKDCKISKQEECGKVHSGDSAVSIAAGGDLFQIVHDVEPCYYYEFCFFAQSNVAFTACVTFLTSHGGCYADKTISVRQGDAVCPGFGYYRVLTDEAPCNTVAVKIEFKAACGSEGTLTIDDVSFAAE